MDITTEAGALFENHSRHKNKAFLLGITIVNPCPSSNLKNAARHAGKHLADAVEREKNKNRGSFPATYSLLPLAVSTRGEVGSDVHALMKKLAIGRVEHRSEVHSNGTQYLAEGAEVAHLRRCFSFVLQQAFSFRTRPHICRQGVALAGIRHLRLQGVHAYRSEEVTGSEGREGANGVKGGIGVGGGDGDGNGIGGGNGDGNGDDGDGAGTRMGLEANEGTQDGNGDGSGGGAETGTGTGVETRERTLDGNGDGSGDGNESSSGDRNGDGSENEIGERGGEAKKRKRPHKSCRLNVGNAGDLGGKRKKRR